MDVRQDKTRALDQDEGIGVPSNLYTRNGTFYARVQVNGREIRKSLQTANRREAEKRLKQMLADVSPYYASSDYTYDDVMGAYLLSAKASLKPKTLRRYTTSALMLTDHFGGKSWASINKQAVLGYIEKRKADGTKIPTIRRDLTTLSQAAEYAIEHQWSDVNPVEQVGKRALRYKAPVFHRPDDRSLRLAIECCHGNIKPLARFLMATGMRLDEAVYLTWDQVNTKRKTATLPGTKNGTTRTVHLGPEALAILKGQPHHIDSPLIFPAINRVTKKPGPYKQASTNWQEAQRRAVAAAEKQKFKLQRMPLHGLRHIFAIDYLANGGNIYQLQLQLGHGSIRQTEWYLQFLSPEEQMKAKFGSAQKPSQPQRFSLAQDGENG